LYSFALDEWNRAFYRFKRSIAEVPAGTWGIISEARGVRREASGKRLKVEGENVERCRL
jgi:hypothetical protein